MKNIYKKFSSSILMPHLIQLDKNLIMASFHLMKLMPAKYIIEKSIQDGLIDPKYPIIETSSGTYALGIGIICAELNIPFHIVSDPAIDINLQTRLENLGGYVQILTQALSLENPQVLRLNAVKEWLRHNPKSFWPSQYNNPDNQTAYYIFAEYLLENIGSEFTLVGTVGSGSSTCGTIRALRTKNSAIRLVGVDTFGSILFGLKNNKRILRGLGNSIMPDNLHHSLFDEVHWVSAQDAFFFTRYLHSKKSCFNGPTTGAAYQVAKWIADNNKDELVVFIAPDTGHRYQENVYNDAWLTGSNLKISQPSSSPIKIVNPDFVVEPWSYIDWNRMSYNQVITQRN